jgi:APA family basic amino acid/polyamine antiporter
MSLKKQIGFLGVFSIASGAMISSGIFVLPGLAFEKAGPAVFLSYFLAGVLGLVGILSVIELSTAMPKAGGDYYFVSKTFGPMLGTVSGILSWVALSLKSAFAVYGITAILSTTLGIEPLISGAVLVAFFCFPQYPRCRGSGVLPGADGPRPDRSHDYFCGGRVFQHQLG